VGAYDNERLVLTDIGLAPNSEVLYIPQPTDRAISFLSASKDVSSWNKPERPGPTFG
jgi:hypothetical protein